MSNIVYLSLGSNLGDREKNLCRAVNNLREMEGFELLANSSLYITEPVGMEKGVPSFMNMVIKGKFKYTPRELLSNIELIEEKLGREREGKGKYLPRPIDIDILLFGDSIIDNDRLTIPHKEMTKRAFVLVPLLDIEPEILHPVTHKRFADCVKKKDRNDIILYKELDEEDVRTKLHCY
jgi:2-amino-4-hydroxy-6-hydroxymethyldihydropteridine diphosphokinase